MKRLRPEHVAQARRFARRPVEELPEPSELDEPEQIDLDEPVRGPQDASDGP